MRLKSSRGRSLDFLPQLKKRGRDCFGFELIWKDRRDSPPILPLFETVFMNAPLRPHFCFCTMLALILVGLNSEACYGQLFSGQRGLGNPIRARQGTLMTGNEGTIEGSERFLRDNRGRRAFVGGDRSEQQGFVGSEQALGTGRVRTSVDSLREFRDRSGRINRPITSPAAGELYLPRLSIDFTANRLTEPLPTVEVQHHLKRYLEARDGPSISVSVVNRRATLRGAVNAEEDASRLEILLSFEPGIDEIVNELVVVPPNEVSPTQAPKSAPIPPNPSSHPR